MSSLASEVRPITGSTAQDEETSHKIVSSVNNATQEKTKIVFGSYISSLPAYEFWAKVGLVLTTTGTGALVGAASGASAVGVGAGPGAAIGAGVGFGIGVVTVLTWDCVAYATWKKKANENVVKSLNAQILETLDDKRFVCPITQEAFQDPVVSIVDGRTYERQAILDHLKQDPRSPFTREKMKPADLRRDYAVLGAVNKAVDIVLAKEVTDSSLSETERAQLKEGLEARKADSKKLVKRCITSELLHMVDQIEKDDRVEPEDVERDTQRLFQAINHGMVSPIVHSAAMKKRAEEEAAKKAAEEHKQ